MRTQMGIQNVLGALYASVIFLGIINSIVLQPIAAENRGVLYRERAAGMVAYTFAIRELWPVALGKSNFI